MLLEWARSSGAPQRSASWLAASRLNRVAKEHASGSLYRRCCCQQPSTARRPTLPAVAAAAPCSAFDAVPSMCPPPAACPCVPRQEDKTTQDRHNVSPDAQLLLDRGQIEDSVCCSFCVYVYASSMHRPKTSKIELSGIRAHPTSCASSCSTDFALPLPAHSP